MTVSAWWSNTPAGGDFFTVAATNPQATLLALDFDGTLAPIVDDPESSSMHEGCAEALSVLGPHLGRLAIITGRAVSAVRRLGRLDQRPGLERLSVFGQYGVERYDTDTGQLRLPPAPDLQRVLSELETLVTSLGQATTGTHLEFKGRAIGVHTRRASNPEGAFAALAGPVAELAGRYGLHLEPGRLVLELRTSTLSKADALTELVDEMHPACVAVVGDDLGDLPALEMLSRLRDEGLTCCAVVSASAELPNALATVADVICEGPDGVAAWLNDFAQCLEA